LKRSLVIVLLLGWSGLANADETDARAHYDRGAALYEAGEYTQALDEFIAARRASQLVALEFNIGRCYERLHRIEEAIAAYRRYANRAPPPQDAADVRRLITILQDLLPKPMPPAALAIAPVTLPKPAARRKSPGPIVLAVAGGLTLLVGAIMTGYARSEYGRLHESCAPSCSPSSWSSLPSTDSAGEAFIVLGSLAAGGDAAWWALDQRREHNTVAVVRF
jgi:tetratricopeptide (TPR) repeat protein